MPAPETRKHSSVLSRRAFRLGAVALFILSIGYFFLVSRVFPYGIVQGDTGTYLLLAQHFHIFHFNELDWARTAPYGFLLRFALHFSNPTMTVYWICSLLYCINIVLLFWMSLGIFRETWVAFAFSAAILMWEIVNADVMLQQLILLADSPLASLTFMGILLILGGRMKESLIPQLLGYAALGLAMFTKPSGMALLPPWMIFACCTLGKDAWRSDSRREWMIFALSLALFVGPNLLWSARNFVLYDTFKPTGYGGFNLLPRVVPLLKDSDRLFDDQKQNDDFIRGVRLFEKNVGTGYAQYSWGSAKGYLCPNALLQTSVLASLYGTRDPSLYELTKANFVVDKLATRTALRIIFAHPEAYLRMVKEDYIALFAPVGGYDWLQVPEPKVLGPIMAELGPWQKNTFFPPDGTIDLSQSDERVRHFLASFSGTSGMLRWIDQWQKTVYTAAIHILFFLSLMALLNRRRLEKLRMRSLDLSNAAICTLMMCVTAFAFNLVASLVELPLKRYALPSEMPMDTAIILSVFVVILLMTEGISRAFSVSLRPSLYWMR